MQAYNLRLMALAAVFSATICTQAWAKVAVIYRTDRDAPMRGELVAEGPDKVVIKIANIDTPIPRNLIARIEYELTVPEQYAVRIAELKADDVAGRYEAIKWLYSLNTDVADLLASGELGKFLAANKDHQQARLLLDLVNQRIKDRAAKQPEPVKPTPPGPGTQPGPAPGPEQETGKARLLTKEERNLMRVIEVVLDDKPRIVMTDKDKSDFYDKYREDPALTDYQGRKGRSTFMQLDGYELLDIIFQTRASEFYEKVTVNDEPKPLQDFRQKIAGGLVARHCGACHGEGKAPGLYVVTDKPTSEETAYTNLLILSRAASRSLPLIDRNLPNESLLLQYALPREEARYPHPEVKGLKQYFLGLEDPRFAEARQWVDSLYPKANYPIQYELPRPAPAEAPKPATP